MSRYKGELILLVLAVVSLGLWGLARTVGARTSVQDGIVQRVARPAVVFWGETTDVELRMDAEELPAPVTTTDISPVYAALVIDRSGSMAGQPIVEARNAASDFADLMNLDPELEMESDAVAVVAFDDIAGLLMPFEQERGQVIGAIQGIQDGGGTAIDAGLALATQQFTVESPPAGTQSLIILLSDGQSNPSAAIAAADLAKGQGIRIVTVALGDADRTVLSQIASSEADAYEASDPTTLIEIYSEIAAGIVGSAATDVTLVEYYNDERFTLASSLYRAQQVGNEITWNLPFVGQRGRTVGYILEPQTLGWHQVSPQAGQISLIDSLNQPLNQVTPDGPRVLVLFPVWLLFIAPTLALLWLLIRALQGLRRPSIGPVVRPEGRKRDMPTKPIRKEEKAGDSGQNVTHGRSTRPPKR
ncbi:MAG: VWA domain-containing protein [Chloroflexi bacterium]|nr:VWA domain-containing protein [Chloroflexota bacterium]MBP8054568.1 VWA domain-containing protein [Chloroflexota bacterium]